MAARVVIVPPYPQGADAGRRHPEALLSKRFPNSFRILFVHAAKDSRSSCAADLRRKRSVRGYGSERNALHFSGFLAPTQTSSVDHPPTSAMIREEVFPLSDPSTPLSIRPASSSPLTIRRGRPVCSSPVRQRPFRFLPPAIPPCPPRRFSRPAPLQQIGKSGECLQGPVHGLLIQVSIGRKISPRRVMLLSTPQGTKPSRLGSFRQKQANGVRANI